MEKYELQDIISKNELEAVKEFFPEMLTTLKDETIDYNHPFRALFSCIFMNNIPNIADQSPDILDFIESLPSDRVLYYSHWLLNITSYHSELVIPLLDKIIDMGIDDENVLLVLSLLADDFPDKLIDLVPRVMMEPKNKYKYYTYRFLSSFAKKRPDVLTPYIEKLKEEQNTLTDSVSEKFLQDCLSYYSQNIGR